MKKKTSNPLDQVIKKVVTLCSTEVEARGLRPLDSQSIPPKSSSSLPMKSFFNLLNTITKPQKKLKATPNAVDLAMDLLLSSQARKQR